jgi:hypothetical protein
MSTSPETRAVNLLSRWLAGHVGDDELRRELAALDGVGPESGDLAAELVAALDHAAGAKSGQVERLVRETLEALALGA